MSKSRFSFNRLSIRKSTLSLAVIPAVLIFVLLTPYNLYERTKDMQHALQKQGRVLADQLAQISEYGLITGNVAYLQDTVEELLLDPEIHSIEILDNKQTKIIVATGRQFDGSGEQLLKFETPVVQKLEPADIFDIVQGITLSRPSDEVSHSPIVSQRIIGTVRVILTEKILRSQQQNIIVNGLLLAVVALLLSALVGQRISVSITKPIGHVLEGVKRIRKGNYKAPIGGVSDNEIGALALDIDALAAELADLKRENETHIVDLTKARDAADRANVSKSDFLALISHEIRSPLNSAFGVVQLLDDTRLNKLQKRYVELARDSFNHLIYLLDDIIDFSSLDYGEIKIEDSPINLRELIEQIRLNYNYVADKKGLRFDLKCTGDAQLQNKSYYGDPTRVRQILTNILDNAFKYTQQGGVFITADWRQDRKNDLEFTLAVRDTGTGIPQEKFDTIFEMFKQATKISNREHGGAGLGLYIVKRLAELMGGSIQIKSEEDLGSCFTLKLTLNPVQSPLGTKKQESSKNKYTFGRILILEDDWANQEVLKGLLNHIGIRVDIANNGKEGINLFLSNDYDLVFVDCYMPEMDGFEFAKTVRNLEIEHGRKRTPLIALTASALVSTEEKCLASGMDDYIAKPYRKFDIYKRITAVYKTEKILNNIILSSKEKE